MTPKSFDVDTAKEMVGDSRVRELEAMARTAADAGVSFFKSYYTAGVALPEGDTYMERRRADFEEVVFRTAHEKRTERVQRMAERTAQPA